MALADYTTRAPSTGRKWAIAAGHPLAAETADALLADGATLVEAIVAASAVLTVVSPQATSLGGDGAMLVRRRDGTIDAYDGAGWAMGEESNTYDAAAFAKGPGSCVVPGLVDLWRLALEDHGRRDLSALLAPAIGIAKTGVPLGKELRKYLVDRRNDFAAEQFFGTMFDGVSSTTRRIPQPALAATLEGLAAGTLRAFYEGKPAVSLRRFLKRLGRDVPESDFTDFHAARVPALFGPYGDWRIAAMPPPFVGLLGLLQLKALGEDDRTADPMARRFVRHPELARRVFERWSGEIRDVWADGASPDDIRNRAASVLQGTVEPVGNRHDSKGGDTAGIAIVMSDGQAASLLQSIFQPFGSRVCDPGTGILLNNRMLCFDPDGANMPARRRRPFHTLNPLIVTGGTDEVLACCSPGGISQTTTCAQVLDAVLGRHLPLDRAVDMDRWSVSRGGAHILENGADGRALDTDIRQSFDEISTPGASFYFGSFKVAIKEGAQLSAFADQRREAASLAR